MENEYLNSLKEELVKHKHDKAYIELCLQYAERLLSNKLPIIFNIEHFCTITEYDIDYIRNIHFRTSLYIIISPFLSEAVKI